MERLLGPFTITQTLPPSQAQELRPYSHIRINFQLEGRPVWQNVVLPMIVTPATSEDRLSASEDDTGTVSRSLDEAPD